MKKFVAYYRVPKVHSSEASFSLEAQRVAVNRYLADVPESALTAEYVESESGRKSSRPKLTTALSEAKATAATLLIAKFQGLGHDASFLRNLQDANVDFACCDNSYVNASTVGALAAMATHQANLISARTKEALAAKKARGETMGTPQNLNEDARTKSLEVRKQKAKEAAEPVSDIIADKRRKDWTYQEIADHLNEAKHTTPRGHQWTPVAVRRVFIIDSILSDMEQDTETNNEQK